MHLIKQCSRIAGICALFTFSASSGLAQVSTDGWGSGPGSPTLSSQSTFGVTLGVGALQSTNPQGSFWGPSTGNLVATGPNLSNGHLVDMQLATTLSLDLTLLSTQINGGSGNFNGFAQSNELSISLFSNAVPTLPSGINLFIQRNFSAGGATDSLSQNGGWNGVDGTRTITWNLTMFSGTDPTDGQTKTVAQLLTAHPDIQFAAVNFVEQFGNGTTTVGPGSFYFDNVRLTGNGVNSLIGNFEPIPEPSSLILVALAAAPVARFVRRRRSPSTEPTDSH